MSENKCDCPNCMKHPDRTGHWPNGDRILEAEDFSKLRVDGLTVEQIRRAVLYARNHGWNENES